MEHEEVVKRRKLSEVYDRHEAEWRQAFQEDPQVTVSKLVAIATGQRMPALQAAKAKMLSNVDRVKRICSEPVDKELNRRGIAQARQALRGG